MRAVVSGSRGFLGRHFVRALREMHASVVAVDIADGNDALDLFRGHDDLHADLVVHCAAVAPHRAAIEGRALAVGAGGLELDAAMFRWAARTKPGRVVYFSSSAAYPVELQTRLARYRLQEDDLAIEAGADASAPDGIYGWVKLTGEWLAHEYRRQGGGVTVVRPFSGYGEDQSADFPFGAFRDRARRREHPFTVWGDGTQVRDWVHVSDVVGAVLAAVENDIDGPVNIASGVGTSMAELAALFAAEAGYDPRFDFRRDQPAGVPYRVGDPTRLNTFYQCRVDVAEGVKRALAA